VADQHDEPRVTRGRHTTGRGNDRRGRHTPTRPGSAPAHLATGRAPTLPTVRQAHPALQTGEHQGGRPGDATTQMPGDPRPRRQELAPWSPHPPPSAAYAEAVTPAGGTAVVEADGGDGSGTTDDPAANDAGRRQRVRRRVGWVLIGGIGLYLVVIALGLAGVLFFGRLSPPGLDRLTRPTGSTKVETDPNADDPGAKSASEASPDTSDGADGPDAAEGPDATDSTASGSAGSKSGAGGATDATGGSGTIDGSTSGTDPAYPIGSTEPTSPPAAPSSGGSGTTDSPTTTTTERSPSSTTPPTTRARSGPPDTPPGRP
jgi:hypothetical protein